MPAAAMLHGSLWAQTHLDDPGSSPSSHEGQSFCPGPALAQGEPCSKHKAVDTPPWGNSESIGSAQPVDKGSNISTFQVNGSGRYSLGLSEVPVDLKK